MTEVLDHLLAVQDLDTSITQLQHRRDALGETMGLVPVEAQLRALAIEEADAAARRGALVATQKELEEQIAGITERRDAIEQRMYAATSSSGRDLQAMNEEVRHLTDRRAQLEEQELVVMLDQEPIDAELRSLGERKAPLERQVDELRGQVAEQQRAIDAELASAIGSRAAGGCTASDGAGGSLRDTARPLEGDRRRPPHQEPVRRVSPRAVLGGGREDPRPATGRDRHLRAVRAHPRARLSACDRADPDPPRGVRGQRAGPSARAYRRRVDRDRPRPSARRRARW